MAQSVEETKIVQSERQHQKNQANLRTELN